jgi:ATP-dependent Clp protease ATP-binding subunit ClpA
MNRIDNYIFFKNLEPSHLKKIAVLALHNIPIKRHKALLDFIVTNGYSEEYGARNIKRFIKNKVATVIAQALLERRLPSKKGDLYTPKIINNELSLVCLKDDKLKNQAAG